MLAVFVVRALAPPFVEEQRNGWQLPDRVQDTLTLAISVIIESVPFVFLGILLSAVVQVWLPHGVLARHLPQNPILRRASISLLGMFFPVCECGNVPLARGFMVGGFTVSESITFVTCCAVDAQPIGVPVYLPGWQAAYEIDDWVQVTGRFDPSVSVAATDPLAITPVEILRVDQPSDPYVY